MYLADGVAVTPRSTAAQEGNLKCGARFYNAPLAQLVSSVRLIIGGSLVQIQGGAPE